MKKRVLREQGKIFSHEPKVENVENVVENTAKPTKKRSTKKRSTKKKEV